MDEAEFWLLVEQSKAEMTPTLSNQAEVLQVKLETLPAQEIAEFHRIFCQMHDRAYRWDLWAAAYIIEGGCSDDGFIDFRAGLIGLGREVYYAALKDPNSLAKLPKRGIDFSNEDMNYAARRAYSAVTGNEIPAGPGSDPREPEGEPWDEETVGEKYPELAAKFDFG